MSQDMSRKEEEVIYLPQNGKRVRFAAPQMNDVPEEPE